MAARVVDGWFWRPEPRSAASARLFCLPQAGGDAPIYAGLARALPEWLELWAVRLPGRGGRWGDPLPGSLAELAAQVATAVHDRSQVPYALAGQSFGAVLAFEVCRQVPAAAAPAGLVVGALPPPGLWASRGQPFTRAELVAYLTRMAGDNAQMQVFLAQPKLLDMAVVTLGADLELFRRHRYQPSGPVAVPVHAIAGSGDPVATPEMMAGWAACTDRGFRLSVLDSGHFPLQTRPVEAAYALAEDLAGWFGPDGGAPALDADGAGAP